MISVPAALQRVVDSIAAYIFDHAEEPLSRPSSSVHLELPVGASGASGTGFKP